jgi:hypothetical protein
VDGRKVTTGDFLKPCFESVRHIHGSFYLLTLILFNMSDKKEKQVTDLQMVELNHNSFAVELLSGNASVNLTQMAKPFGRSKRPEVWLKTQDAKDYIYALSVALKSATVDLLKVKQGGTNQGTFCTDYRIAMRFAQWLSTDFAIAVDDLLVKLLTRQAIFAHEFNGIPPVAYGGKLWYNYLDVLESLGYSRRSGSVAKRRQQAPGQFAKFYNRNFVTFGYCSYLKQRRSTQQLSFNFNAGLL